MRHKVWDDHEVRDKLEAMKDAVKRAGPLMNELGEAQVTATRQRIRGGNMTPLSPLTKAYKGGTRPLQDTGALLASIHYKAGDDSVEVGTDRPQAPMLQNGGTIRPKKAKKLAIPASSFTRKCERRYGKSARNVIDGLKADGWNVFVTDKSIQARKGDRTELLYVRAKKAVIPARPFLFLSDKDNARIAKAIKQFFKEAK